MSRRTLTGWIAFCLLACSNHPRPRAEPAPAPAAVQGPAAHQAAAPPAEDPDPTPDELPLPEDFAAEAAAQISSANFRSELDAIEKELNPELPHAAQQAP